MSKVSLRDYFEARLETVQSELRAAREAVGLALTASKEATKKADIATEKRLEGTNEWRQAFTDREANFAPRDDTERRLKALERQAWMLSGVLAFVTVAMAGIGLLYMIFGKK